MGIKENEYARTWWNKNKDRLNEKQRLKYKIDPAYREKAKLNSRKRDKLKKSLENKQYKIKNKDKIKNTNHEYYIKNKDRIRIQAKQYREKNKDKIIQQKHEYYIRNKRIEHPKVIKTKKVSNREYYVFNKDKIAKTTRIRYIRNKDKILQQTKQYRKKHPEVRLKSHINYFEKHGKLFNMDKFVYKRALQSWSGVIRKHQPLCQASIQPQDQLIINSITGINTPIPEITKAIHSHHILFKSLYPKLSLNISNGIALSKREHDIVHGWNLNG